MSSARVYLCLIPARDDRAIGSVALQAVFGKCRAFLRLRGVAVSTPMFSGEAETAAGCYAGEFVIPLRWAAEAPVETVLDAWFEGRPGRVVRLRVGDLQAEAWSTQEAETFLRSAQQLRETPWVYDEN
jgi:hypothetical protein